MLSESLLILKDILIALLIVLVVVNIVYYLYNLKKNSYSTQNIIENKNLEFSEISVKEGLAALSSFDAHAPVTKLSIIRHLRFTFFNTVKIKHRKNRTKPAKGKTEGLLLADTHYDVKKLKDGKNLDTCFVFVYECNHQILLLLRSNDKYMRELKKHHININRSKFPKSKQNWFSVAIDYSFNNKQVYEMIDVCKKLCAFNTVEEQDKFLLANGYIHEENIPVNEVEPTQELSLKESLNVASLSNVDNTLSKKIIAKYLRDKYGNEVEVNEKPNMTTPLKGHSEGVPRSDNHYTLKNGRVCFVYVYEVNGSILLLIKANEEFGEQLHKSHKKVAKSLFPKSKTPWYSVPVDNTFTKEEVFKLLDDVKTLNENGSETVEPTQELSLKESLNVASLSKVDNTLSKKIIAKYLRDKYGNEVEVNEKPNMTTPLKGHSEGVPRSDNHYTLKNGRVCFVYVYEVNGSILLLIKANEEFGEQLHKLHKKVAKSLFPKSKTPWYSVPVDNTFTKEEVFKLLDDVKALNEIEIKSAETPVKKVVVEEKINSTTEINVKEDEIKKVAEDPVVDTKEKEIAITTDTIQQIKEVSVSEAQTLMSDSDAILFTIKGSATVNKAKKTIINIDTISNAFKSGETVTIEELKKRIPSFDKKATCYKVCARGVLDKSLIVYADDFSIEAKKMILLTGGKVIQNK